MINKIKNHRINFYTYSFSIDSIIKSPLFSGSAIMIFGTNFANFLAYIYHLIMGRILGPSSYSELAAMIATLGLFTTAYSFLGMVIMKFVASENKKNITNIYHWFLRKAEVAALIIALIFLIFSGNISRFLNIPYKSALIVGPIISAFLLVFINRAFLQGLLKFKSVVFISGIELLLRIILGLALVYVGFSSYGAIVGILLSAIVTYTISKIFLRDLSRLNSNHVFENSKKILKYSLPVILFSVSNNLFLTTDVILTKHYFDAHTAGLYAAVSTLGKIIFYGTGPVGAVMFPLIAKRYSEGTNYKSILFFSIILTAGISFGVSLIYLFFPELMVRILFGSEYLDASKYIFIFSLFVVIYSLSNLIAAYFMSIERTKIVVIPFIASLIQLIGILIFHNNVNQIIIVSIISALTMLAGLSTYLIYGNKTKTKP